MPVDYRRQYEPEHLEPMWPTAAIRGIVAALCTLAVMIVLAVLPVLLEHWGFAHWIEESSPADPRVTPDHIRPEWYFLASYQSLKLFPSEFLGISGTALGVLSQGLVMLAVCLLPFWARRPPSAFHSICVTVVVAAFLAMTLWGAWPPSPILVITVCTVVVTFFVLLAGERLRIGRLIRCTEDADL